MVSSLIFTSLSFHPTSLLNCWALELVEQDELLTTFGDHELVNMEELETSYWIEESEKPIAIEKHNELQNLLWDQELEELLTNKPFQLDQVQDYNQQQQQQDQLEKNNAWSIQLQQNLSENEKNKKNAKKKLETNKEFHQSFANMILKKLVALLLDEHFALAASFQLNH